MSVTNLNEVFIVSAYGVGLKLERYFVFFPKRCESFGQIAFRYSDCWKYLVQSFLFFPNCQRFTCGGRELYQIKTEHENFN